MKKFLTFIALFIMFLPFHVHGEVNYLYDVLKNETENGGLAREYTGEHHDSFTEEPSYKIYHWYAENDEQGSQVIEKNNVIFGNYCWQIIRTTDTGGVKLIYNGIPNDGKCNNTGEGTTIGLSSFQQNRNSIAYVGYMYNPDTVLTTRIAEYTPRYGTRFAESFSYSDNMFNLNNTSSSLSFTRHYGCLNGTNSCSQIAYYFALANGYYSYVLIDSNKTVDIVLREMLSSDNVNSTNSNIKEYIDNWYHDNLDSYSKYIEDTIYCNDRSIKNLAGWNPNGGNTNNFLYFKNGDESLDLVCTNETDKFSLSNDLAKLDYPIGLISRPELELLNNDVVRNADIKYYTMSPNEFMGTTVIEAVDSFGKMTSSINITANNGIRPSISLKLGTRYNAGDGSKDNPYIIDLKDYYSIDIESKDETENLTVDLDDFTMIEEGKEIKFTVIPKYGYEVDYIKIIDSNGNEIDYSKTDVLNEYIFTMPASNITIVPVYKTVNDISDNPYTGNMLLIILLLISCFGIGLSIYKKERN